MSDIIIIIIIIIIIAVSKIILVVPFAVKLLKAGGASLHAQKATSCS